MRDLKAVRQAVPLALAACLARARDVRDEPLSSGLVLAHYRDDVLRVHVTASPHTRERRLADALGIDPKEAAQTLKRSDAGRADYIKRFYGLGAEEPTHYDLVINTDKLQPQEAVELIIHAAGAAASAEQAPAG